MVAHRESIGAVKRRAYRDQTYWARPLPGFGDPNARMLIVGLAPAAHGANRTGRMFTGDRSGLWLYRALHRAGFANRPESSGPGDGLRLDDAYITAAARCAPPGNRPTPVELDACRPFLIEEIEILRRGAGDGALLLLALGAIAFNACLHAAQRLEVELPRPRPRFGHRVEHRLRDDLIVLCSYHPSQQNTQTGRLTEPMFDAVFERASEILR